MSSSNSMLNNRVANNVVRQNDNLTALACLRCGKTYRLDDLVIDSGLGCTACLEAGFPVGLQCIYDPAAKLEIERDKTGILKFSSKLPFSDFPSLGEGMTPLVPLSRLAAELGVENVSIKNEGQNPTGSHKDRMSPFAVARAICAGFSKVVASSSGNAGASLASYAARAGLQCMIIAAPDISSAWAHAIKSSGAELRIVECSERWPLMQKLVQEDGWFPVTNFWPTPVGSNPFGIDGYKTIAHEIVEQHIGAAPNVVIVPTCRGDMLFGIYRGFVEALEAGLIKQIPRLIAAEPGARLQLALQGRDYRSVFDVPVNNMTSIDGNTATYQSLKALKESNGDAVCVSAQQCVTAAKKLAEQGFHVEMSSAASLAGLMQMRQDGKLTNTDRVVLIVTSHGYKEPLDEGVSPNVRLCN